MIVWKYCLLLLFNTQHALTVEEPALQRLHKHLFRDYDRSMKPRRNHAERIEVDVSLLPEGINEVNERSGEVSVGFFLELAWRDDFLSWPEDEFDGIKCILVPILTLWLPSLNFLYNLVVENTRPKLTDAAFVCSNGTVTENHHVSVTVAVDFKVNDFPFDKQFVDLYMGHNIAGINEFLPKPAVNTYEDILAIGYTVTALPDWEIANYSCESKTVEYNAKFYSVYPEIHCRLTIARRPAYFSVNFCIPSVFVTILSLAGIHCVPLATGQRGSKFKLAMTSIMSLSILTLSIAAGMPRTKLGVSRLHIFYYSLLSLIAAATISSLVGVAIHKRCEKSLIPDILDALSFILLLVVLFFLCYWFFSWGL